MTITEQPHRPATEVRLVGATPPFQMDPRAACRGVDPDVMYPSHSSDVPAAKKVCRPCPIQDECAAWGVEHELFGVWGGLDEKERRQIRRERKEKAAR